MTSREYKLKAKTAMLARRPNIIVAGAIFVLVSSVFNFFVHRITLGGFTNENLERMMYFARSGDIQSFTAVYAVSAPKAWQEGVRILVDFLLSVIELGFMVFIFNKLRRTGEAMYENLLDGFSYFLRFLGIYVLKTIFISLWSLLLVVPGIIAAYRYRMAEYIMLDHPEYSAWQCIQESKRMMKGNKWRLFCLDFSFIGWHILGVFAPYVVQLWTVPYISTSVVMFYESLANPERYAEFPLLPVMPTPPRM